MKIRLQLHCSRKKYKIKITENLIVILMFSNMTLKFSLHNIDVGIDSWELLCYISFSLLFPVVVSLYCVFANLLYGFTHSSFI